MQWLLNWKRRERGFWGCNRLKQELLEDPVFDLMEEAKRPVEQMLDYNVRGGKLNRGISVIQTYKLLKDGEEISDEEFFLSGVLGWSIEWDDYLDCFGDPEVTGKIGTDIEDHKCSWLIVQAIERANEDQLKILNDNYEKPDPNCVKKVKSVYEELDLENVYFEYELSSYMDLISSIEAQPNPAIQEVLNPF
ncbi:hypothetical protein LUZ60_003267 [Juncus effusus]|nr:hypothetical protein LUZ60_003267 [Juncus effusus]